MTWRYMTFYCTVCLRIGTLGLFVSGGLMINGNPALLIVMSDVAGMHGVL